MKRRAIGIAHVKFKVIDQFLNRADEFIYNAPQRAEVLGVSLVEYIDNYVSYLPEHLRKHVKEDMLKRLRARSIRPMNQLKPFLTPIQELSPHPQLQ